MTFWEGNRKADVAVVERPPLVSVKLEATPVRASNTDDLVEYIELAGAVGIAPPDLVIEEFKQFLVQEDIPTFSLAEVVSYMDEKAANESKDKCGWEWHPLREQDHRPGIVFGRQAERHATGVRLAAGEMAAAQMMNMSLQQYQQNYRQAVNNMPAQLVNTIAASDWYRGPTTGISPTGMGATALNINPASAGIYDKTIPLHALRKVAKITRAFGAKVGLFVCDYALAPQIQYPDPFLMAVVSNPRVGNGTGRFVIDFWDEPGFGLDRQLKAAE